MVKSLLVISDHWYCNQIMDVAMVSIPGEVWKQHAVFGTICCHLPWKLQSMSMPKPCQGDFLSDDSAISSPIFTVVNRCSLFASFSDSQYSLNQQSLQNALAHVGSNPCSPSKHPPTQKPIPKLSFLGDRSPIFGDSFFQDNTNIDANPILKATGKKTLLRDLIETVYMLQSTWIFEHSGYTLGETHLENPPFPNGLSMEMVSFPESSRLSMVSSEN